MLDHETPRRITHCGVNKSREATFYAQSICSTTKINPAIKSTDGKGPTVAILMLTAFSRISAILENHPGSFDWKTFSGTI